MVLAARSRRFAVAVSWIALVAVILGTPDFGFATHPDVPDALAFAALLAVLIGLPVSSLLPGISSWHVRQGGTVSVSPVVVVVRSPRHEPRWLRFEHLAVAGLGHPSDELLSHSAGPGGGGKPGLHGVSERHLSYPPESDVSVLADEAEALGRVPVHRVTVQRG